MWGAVIRTKDTGRGGEQWESNGRGCSSGIKADFFLTKLIQFILPLLIVDNITLNVNYSIEGKKGLNLFKAYLFG